jgi:hypothetical protein
LTITGWDQGVRLKAADARNHPKPVKVALRTRDKVAQTRDELLRLIKNLNPGLHSENWISTLSRKARDLSYI